jgi:hypothetical protein
MLMVKPTATRISLVGSARLSVTDGCRDGAVMGHPASTQADWVVNIAQSRKHHTRAERAVLLWACGTRVGAF